MRVGRRLRPGDRRALLDARVVRVIDAVELDQLRALELGEGDVVVERVRAELEDVVDRPGTIVRFEPVLPTLTAVTQTFCAFAGAGTVTSKPWPPTVGGDTILAAPCVATGGSGRFATTVRLWTPSTLMWTVSGGRPADRRRSPARLTRTDCRWSSGAPGSTCTTGLFDGGGGGALTQISSTQDVAGRAVDEASSSPGGIASAAGAVASRATTAVLTVRVRLGHELPPEWRGGLGGHRH